MKNTTKERLGDYLIKHRKFVYCAEAVLLVGSVILTSLGLNKYIKEHSNHANSQQVYHNNKVRGKIINPQISEEEVMKKASDLDKII